MRVTIVINAFIVLAACCGVCPGQEASKEEGIADKLEKAKEAFIAKQEKLKAPVLKQFDNAEKQARKKADPDLIAEIGREREAFETDRKIPSAINTDAFQKDYARALNEALKAFDAAKRAYIELGKDDEAKGVLDARAEFERENELDIPASPDGKFDKGSVWEGVRVFKDPTYPGAQSQSRLTVTLRRGNEFKGTVIQIDKDTGVKKLNDVQGTVKKGQISFRETGGGQLFIQYKGSISDDLIHYEFEGVGDGGKSRFGNGRMTKQ